MGCEIKATENQQNARKVPKRIKLKHSDQGRVGSSEASHEASAATAGSLEPATGGRDSRL
jgi:hypothetical protein